MSDPWEESLFVDRAAHDPDAPVTPFVIMQRVVVRMLFDPNFVDAVYNRTDEALEGLSLAPDLVRQLLENDRRLWNADTTRRSRALKVLMDEFRVSTTLVLWEQRRIAFLDAFFGSPEFHDAVTRRGYMAIAFCAYLERKLREGALESPQLRAALALEAGMALSRRELRDARRGHDPTLRRLDTVLAPTDRRAREEPWSPGTHGPPETHWVVGAGVRALELPGGVLELIQHVETWLFEIGLVPALALCEDSPSPEPLPELQPERTESFLLEPQKGGKVDLNSIPATFARIISACSRPRDRAGLHAALRSPARDLADLDDHVEQLVEAEVLRRVEVDSTGAVTPLD